MSVGRMLTRHKKKLLKKKKIIMNTDFLLDEILRNVKNDGEVV